MGSPEEARVTGNGAVVEVVFRRAVRYPRVGSSGQPQ